ncbi:helix-turn-helix domain-containing protein [Wukongibacter baidiensis]|uniref:helix-turn-helix domain-containing protein n=1 Tax=Wukongibacter baidiensis TaxID=1723361 RepID=UPI003D7FCB20
MEKYVYTVREVAKVLEIGMNSAYDLIHENVIPHIRLGRKIRIPKKAFDEWLNEAGIKNLKENDSFNNNGLSIVKVS